MPRPLCVAWCCCASRRLVVRLVGVVFPAGSHHCMLRPCAGKTSLSICMDVLMMKKIKKYLLNMHETTKATVGRKQGPSVNFCCCSCERFDGQGLLVGQKQLYTPRHLKTREPVLLLLSTWHDFQGNQRRRVGRSILLSKAKAALLHGKVRGDVFIHFQQRPVHLTESNCQVTKPACIGRVSVAQYHHVVLPSPSIHAVESPLSP